ncbi:UDP-N-acetylenolpyruvoylglucosamine reductase [Bifidobacterium aemilianum]|uniref:UDP-N-acetylenolpyruvoylglucosamine reductase n=1 Tax=Bifidobacterium aemilianum TaxID=2493120 RepID=A0A366K773_9BIFI|nr:FAD-binding protein [Bifidobacterium aemilianum]RBP97585.1 UDP-N-acetylenolpyruvoylglucosamine reductase [Bifidobacterium aemilianum]
MGVGGSIKRFLEPTSRVGLIEAVEDADDAGLPLLVIGGGSNLLAADTPFEGVVVRDACQLLTVPDEVAPVEDGQPVAHINAEAGCNWDDFVVFAIELGFSGVEGLSGIPGTVGASVVQNIGAYGQEVADSVESVEVWDRQDKRVKNLSYQDMRFSYRSSLLKESMYREPGLPAESYFPTPRYVVISVTFQLRHDSLGHVSFPQLASALGVDVGARMPTADIRRAVLAVRARKGMLEDANRYHNPWMASTKREGNVAADLDRQAEETGSQGADPSRHSAGSFFMNPLLTPDQARTLPAQAPRYQATMPDGTEAVKTSAAWLIDHAGFHKGYALAPDARAALSPLHTLALTNRSGANADDLMALAKAVQEGVRDTYGVQLLPEPVLLGIRLG